MLDDGHKYGMSGLTPLGWLILIIIVAAGVGVLFFTAF